MTDLNYNASFYKAEIRADIRDRLGEILKNKPINERDELAGRAIDAILELGNHAVYHGIVEYGVKIIMSGFATNTRNEYDEES